MQRSETILEKTRRVDIIIIDFVNAEDIDDRFFETPYYSVPTKGGEHAYALLREAIRTAGRVGIAKFILQDALHLAAVEVIGDAMRMIQGKVKGKKVELEPATEHREVKVLDLMERLRQSLAQGGAKSAAPGQRRVKATLKSARKKWTRRAA